MAKRAQYRIREETEQDGLHFDMRRRDNSVQASLFPTEELVVPEKVRTMRKAVAAVYALPAKGETLNFSLIVRKVFDALIILAQLDVRARGNFEQIRDLRVSPLFEVGVRDIARIAAIPGKNYQRIYDALEELLRTIFEWNVIGEEGEVAWGMRAPFLSSYGSGKGKKAGKVRYSIDPDLLVLLLEPSRWAQLSLDALSHFKSVPAYSLYQVAFRYVGTASKLTADLPTEMWVDLISGRGTRYVKDVGNGEQICVSYGDWKRRALLPAMQQVNECPALNYSLELVEKYAGRRVVKLQFRFNYKRQQSLGIPVTWPPEVVTVLVNLGYTETEIEGLSQLYSCELVAEGLVALERAVTRMQEAGKRITTRKGYLAGILKNLVNGVTEKEMNDDSLAEEVNRQHAEEENRSRQELMARKFQEHQLEKLSAWFFSLEENAQQALMTAVQDSNKLPALAPVLSRLPKPGAKAWMLFKAVQDWLGAHQPDELKRILPNPEDNALDAWMAWKLTA